MNNMNTEDHPDFKMRHYANTSSSLSVFDRPFDFAVPCRGYRDYTRRAYAAGDCEKDMEWVLFSVDDEAVLKRLRDDLDFDSLAERCATRTPGFRMNDVVQAYTALWGESVQKAHKLED